MINFSLFLFFIFKKHAKCIWNICISIAFNLERYWQWHIWFPSLRVLCKCNPTIGRIAAIKTKELNTLFHFRYNHYSHVYSPVTHIHINLHTCCTFLPLFLVRSQSRLPDWNDVVLCNLQKHVYKLRILLWHARMDFWASDDYGGTYDPSNWGVSTRSQLIIRH